MLESQTQMKKAAANAGVQPKERQTSALDRQSVVVLQQSVGNRAFGGALKHLQQTAMPGPAIQAKLMVNLPGDAYEQEAEKVADQVMRMEDPAVQRACDCGGACSTCESEKETSEQVQRMPDAEAGPADSGPAPAIVHEALGSTGQPLDASTLGFMESRFGHDFRGVRVHVDGRASASAAALHARAYTVGHDVVFGAGQFAPDTAAGRRLLAHELTHTIQQGSGLRMKRDAVVQRRENTEDDSAQDEDSLSSQDHEPDEDSAEEDGSSEDCMADMDESSEREAEEDDVVQMSPGPDKGWWARWRERGWKRKETNECIWHGERRGGRVPGTWGRKRRKKHRLRKFLRKQVKCCTEYDLSEMNGEELPAGSQPTVIDQETKRDLPPLPRSCTYIVRWNMFEFADQMIITDSKTGRVYYDRGPNQFEDQAMITGPANVHIRVIPNATLKPTKYNFNITKMCGRVKVTKTCYLAGVPISRRVSYVQWKPGKDYQSHCDDEKG